MFRSPIPPSPPQTVPIWAIDQRERQALPADKNIVVAEKSVNSSFTVSFLLIRFMSHDYTQAVL